MITMTTMITIVASPASPTVPNSADDDDTHDRHDDDGNFIIAPPASLQRRLMPQCLQECRITREQGYDYDNGDVHDHHNVEITMTTNSA